MQMGPIIAIRLGSSAQEKLVAKESGSSREGDLIEAVEVEDANGAILRFAGDTLDPERLPFQLKQWAQRLAAANGGVVPTEKSRVKLKVRRHRNEAGPQFESVDTVVAWDDDWRFDDVRPIDASSPMPIPELGLAYQVKTIVATVLPGAANPLEVGDVIKNIRYTYVTANGEEKTTSWLSDNLEEGQWARVTFDLQRSNLKITSVEVRRERATKVEDVTITPEIDKALPLENRGWALMPDKHIQRADSFSGAIALGLHDTRNGMIQVFQNLRGMVTGRLSIKNLGGPVLIANAAFQIAGYDIWEFVFFLGLISVNLAVVNFLPIPVLDGGHMVFLIYEKLRGRPASEPIRVVATYAGLALILSLFLVVTWNDIMRMFF
jgi:regulator of sigma E protease